MYLNGFGISTMCRIMKLSPVACGNTRGNRKALALLLSCIGAASAILLIKRNIETIPPQKPKTMLRKTEWSIVPGVSNLTINVFWKDFGTVKSRCWISYHTIREYYRA